MKLVKPILIVLLFCLLTVLTQIGGLVYIISISFHKWVNKTIKNKYYRQLTIFAIFVFLYCFSTFVVVPPLARLWGRVPLPIAETNHLRPLNQLTCLFNRNYVRPQLKQATYTVASEINKRYPGSTLNYLDASFPFINGFPLMPHLSHNDGKKLDLAFFYIDNKTGLRTDKAPSPIGYGISEKPRTGEINTTQTCLIKGYWQYSFLTQIVPQGNKVNFTFDSVRTKDLVNLFAAQNAINKIFIEPHLKTRLKITTPKIRFHGCRAVRHDDHIHVQL
ncbi:hypothetical protein [Mucilaginibacter rubeus]|uniref:Uncharacterized protein n=1 Tax=Mucilaginibacter rubeus TaxID=2027860 RepID=A0A5C1HZY6_9SPHI|nr:hypothetical protein [Mucilaginibacter rubeus]QEM11244.1 hypothetical protein DEO27_014840 [Mucilaginibacter rubeus]